MAWILLLGVVLFFGVRLTTAEDRVRMAARALEIAKLLVHVLRTRPPELDALRDKLRARTPVPIVTPALIALNVIVFVLLRVKSTAEGSDALLEWGASLGTRTTNGEWWRLVTAAFVHPTFMHLVINVAAIAVVALLLERYVGWLTTLAVYLSAGIVSSLMTIRAYPIVVSGGASGSVFGLYGLLAGCGSWLLFHQIRQAKASRDAESASVESEPESDAQTIAASSDDAIVDDLRIDVPLVAVKRLVPLTLLFQLYSMANDGLPLAGEVAAFGIGLAAGLFLTKETRDAKPEARQVGIAALAASTIAVVLAFPLRGIADVKPEIERVVALEARTAGLYETEYGRFKHGRTNAQSLVETIDRTILPDLQAEDRRLKALTHVPPEHQPLVDDAVQYVQLRSESWRLRADGLRKVGTIPTRKDKETGLPSDTVWRLQAENQYRKNLLAFGKAEGAERASLEALRRITP